eukprot:5467671-Amphidinium_carterae.1
MALEQMEQEREVQDYRRLPAMCDAVARRAPCETLCDNEEETGVRRCQWPGKCKVLPAGSALVTRHRNNEGVMTNAMRLWRTVPLAEDPQSIIELMRRGGIYSKGRNQAIPALSAYVFVCYSVFAISCPCWLGPCGASALKEAAGVLPPPVECAEAKEHMIVWLRHDTESHAVWKPPMLFT